VHLANGDALPMLQAARSEGLPITVETCPHYLHFEAEQIADGDTRFKCAPPIRHPNHRAMLWEGLRRGLIDTIGSDHSPCPPDMKRLDTGDFTKAWGGIASLQLPLPIVWTGAAAHGVSLDQMFRWLAAAPARLLRVQHRKGCLAAGCEADVVVWDPEARWSGSSQQLHHRHKLTPYDGVELSGRVSRTYLRGSLVYNEGNFVGEPHGALLSGVE
jgi:allantoinase